MTQLGKVAPPIYRLSIRLPGGRNPPRSSTINKWGALLFPTLSYMLDDVRWLDVRWLDVRDRPTPYHSGSEV
eukprot:1194834-Prorocentrum_minimum.AAC.5